MSENRFLQTFYAVAAGAVLVCSTMLFLVATSDWGYPTSDREASMLTRVDAAQPSTRSEAPPIDPPSAAPPLASDQVDFDFTASTAGLPQAIEPGASLEPEKSAPESDAGARTDLATRPGPADAPADEVGREPATEADAIASDVDEDAAPEVTMSAPSEPTRPLTDDTSNAASVEQPVAEEMTPPATPQVAEAKAAEPSQTETPVASDASEAANAERATREATTPPASPLVAEVTTAEPSQPAGPVASYAGNTANAEQTTTEPTTTPASPPVAEVKVAEPSQPTDPVANDASQAANTEPATTPASPPVVEAKIAEPFQPASPVANDASKTVDIKPVTKHGPTPPDKSKLAEASPPSKQAAPVARARAQEASAPPRGKAPWKAMTLAPADKPSVSLSKVPTSRPSASGYRAKIWSALARHKPKAGQRGSATVIFAIGQNGALRGVRVGRSSGNKGLDQLALATVRNAAPYPAPPGGAQSFTIRIDFH